MRIELTADAGGVWPEVELLHTEAWPDDDPSSQLWDQVAWSNAEWRVLVRGDDGVLLAHVGIYVREVRCDGVPTRIGGVGGVATRLSHRRRGLAAAAMRRAEGFFREEGVAFALLVCEEKNVPVYLSLGWQRFGGEVMIEQPSGRCRFDLSGAMVLSITATAPTGGVIDLCGCPW